MPASAERDAVEREVAELERLCGALENSLVSGRWEDAAGALRDSRRITHAYLNAMEAAAPFRDEVFDQAIYARMRRVFDAREDQLMRLQAFHDGIGERLAMFGRWKAFARSIGARKSRRGSLGLDSSR